ncbi:hypothetical protein [Peribacillus frigoritolerans]|uniref:hypothetical protein n=1 Tax=Peribacillus frigoritolerans TaxID=450367 RepID=UPI00207A7EB4|nr:hypothetical protein [Peribacillus frigoritolerans]USK64845.1 hypothetical protein LIT26_27710 [Peribacillus frigoritolerans]
MLFSYYDVRSEVTIGNSVEVTSNQFILPITVNAYEDIKNLRISIPNAMEEKQVKSNLPLNIKLVKNNIGTGSVFEITKFSQNSNVELILTTDKPINDKDIVLVDNGNKIDLKYASDIENPAKKQNKIIITNAVIFALMMGVNTYVSGKRRESQIKALEGKIAVLDETVRIDDEKVKELRKELNNVVIQFEKRNSSNMKSKILLLAKLNDYRKELSFWRDTIRKIIYQLPNGENKAEQLVKIVSKSLKTYQTHEKQENDFESLKVLSKMVRDFDEDDGIGG